MSFLTAVACLALAVAFVSERLLGGITGLTICAVVGFGVTIAGFFFRRRSASGGHRYGLTVMIVAAVVTLIGIALYPLSLDVVASSFGLSGESLDRFTGAFGALWPLIATIGLTVLLMVDYALVSSPILIPKSQVARAMSSALSVAFTLGIVFSVNFIADRHNTRWDLSYFKTSEPGSATKAIVADAPSPLVVRIFQAPSSAVSIELRSYFDPLVGPNLSYEVLDLPAEPEWSQKLRIRDNGYVSISTASIDVGATEREPGGPVTRPQTIKIGSDINDRETKQNLRQLDSLFSHTVLKLLRGRMNAYAVSGHGERGAKKGDALNRTKALFEGIEQFNFRIRDLGGADGLSNAVPDNADVILLLGPDFGLSEIEVDTLIAYLEQGGSLLLAVEPDALRQKAAFGDKTDATPKLLAYLGLELEDGMLAGTKGVIRITNSRQDRLNLVTDKFGSHPSVKTLVGRSGEYQLLVSGAAALKETKKGEGKTTVTVQMPPGTWLDLDRDLAPGAKEQKRSYPIAAASTGGTGDKTFRAVVVGDVSMFSDFAMRNAGNQRFALDVLNWLTHSEALSGETKSEQDVKFQPRKAEQSVWFYLTVLGIPLLVVAVGGVRIRRRYGRGD